MKVTKKLIVALLVGGTISALLSGCSLWDKITGKKAEEAPVAVEEPIVLATAAPAEPVAEVAAPAEGGTEEAAPEAQAEVKEEKKEEAKT
ncbi:MAG: hypothetical protein LBJ38_03355 [Oscillospiraceae bacterium]|jgi:hypothetical protein|nr:hypothetical protein [Oscillospiraceae bacterium]